MRQGLGLVLKVKNFQESSLLYIILKIWLAAKIELSINSHFLTAYILNPIIH